MSSALEEVKNLGSAGIPGCFGFESIRFASELGLAAPVVSPSAVASGGQGQTGVRDRFAPVVMGGTSGPALVIPVNRDLLLETYLNEADHLIYQHQQAFNF